VYEHGGLSAQESVVPRLVVTKAEPGSSATQVRVDFTWVGLTLQVEYEALGGAHVDLRKRANDPDSSLVARPKPLKDGKARLLASDEHEGEAAFVVVLDADHRPIAQQLTQIPEG
jgi:hypothetical protein